ncbi:MAG: hypothetical protein JWN10_1223 [Solirubrobacterales bacterium]|nr:hypothetical protein [Solirubrobacterales bacterium]
MSRREKGEKLQQTKAPELPASAVVGGLAVLAGVAVWQLGIEFERAWIRSYDAPPLGEARVSELVGSSQRARIGPVATASGEHRRWVANHHARDVARAPHLTRSRHR